VELRRTSLGLLAILALIGCEASTNSVPAFDGGAPDSTTLDADLPPMPDASTDASTDAGVDAQPPRPEGVAPANLVPDATAEVPSLETALAPGESRLVRVEVGASEHVGFGLFFDPSDADVVMYVDRFDGTGESELGLTDGGPGVRFLAVFEPEGARAPPAALAESRQPHPGAGVGGSLPRHGALAALRLRTALTGAAPDFPALAISGSARRPLVGFASET